jgi:ATP-dependent 26S proteasome regulatory subunit
MSQSNFSKKIYFWFKALIIVAGFYGIWKIKQRSDNIHNQAKMEQQKKKKEEEDALDNYLQGVQKQLQEEQTQRGQEQKEIETKTKLIQDQLTTLNQEIEFLNDQIQVLEKELKKNNSLTPEKRQEKENQLIELKKEHQGKIIQFKTIKKSISSLYLSKQNNQKKIQWLNYQHTNLQKQGVLEDKIKTLEEAMAYNQANKERIKVLLSQNVNDQTTFDNLKAYNLFLDSQLVAFSNQLTNLRQELNARRNNQSWSNEKKKIVFEDVYGMEREKDELADLVTYLKAERVSLVNFDQIRPRGYLLYGPPGTGKSFLMKALCHETGAYYLEVDPSCFDKTYVGEGVEELEKIWNEAEKHEKSIIFIDEISGLANRDKSSNSRGGECSRIAVNIVNNLLLKLDGFKSSQKKIVLMAATNHLNQIDSALKNRFSKLIKIDLIQDNEIEGFFKHQLRNYQISFHTFCHLREIARRCRGKGYSNRDLTKILDNAYQKTFRYQHTSMLPSDLEEVLDFQQNIKKNLTDIKNYRIKCEKEYQDWLEGIKSYFPDKKI